MFTTEFGKWDPVVKAQYRNIKESEPCTDKKTMVWHSRAEITALEIDGQSSRNPKATSEN